MSVKRQNTKGSTTIFLGKLSEYKKLIDADIELYSKNIQRSTLSNYGAYSRVATDVFIDILKRGGKRIRGSLVITGYEMMGGENRKMIVQASRAIEMIHAYILIMDDIQDNSLVRRGGPTAHVALADYHRKHYLSGDSEHFGISQALNAMGIGNHASQVIVLNLDVDEELRIKASSILNQSIVTTAHGQTNDIMNEVNSDVQMKDIDNVLEWKTAYYTFLNPLTFGMVLAGADCRATDAVRDYCMSAGRAFQITDDILGIFGSEFESGKSPMDDIKEGKKTLLSLYALQNTDKADKNFLIQMLGNKDLTMSEFERCRDIIVDSGSLEYAKKEATRCIEYAKKSIRKQTIDWNREGVDFLVGLADTLVDRRA